MVISGSGRHMGLDVAWTWRYRPDGAFHEEVTGEHLTMSWGHDGGVESHSWDVCPSPQSHA